MSPTREMDAQWFRRTLGSSSTLMELLELASLDDNLFLGRQPTTELQRVFGGQVAAQSLVAAGATVDPSLAVHSLHSYFLRPGDYQVPIVYSVEALRDGRSFSNRRVTAQQRGRAIYTAIVGFHRPEPGLSHQSTMPTVAGPDLATPFSEVMRKRGTPFSAAWEREWSSLDVRWLEDSRDGLSTPSPHEAVIRLWLRAREDLPSDPLIQAAAFTFASDISLLGSTLVSHEVEPGGILAASLDHAIWFHRPFRSDEWWLYDQVSPTARSARGFARGSVFLPSGELVASVAQEVLIRPVTAPQAQSRG